MAELMRVPEVTAGATEVVLAEWIVPVGTEVVAGAALAVIETDKAVIEIEAESGGVLLSVLVQAGQRVDVGSPLAILGTHDEADADPETLMRQVGLEGAGEQSSLDAVPEEEEESPAPDPSPIPVDDVDAPSRTSRRHFVSPLARKMLAAAGIDAAEVTGSGPRGRIRRRDVELAVAARSDRRSAAEPGTVVSVGAAAPGGFTAIPHTRMRRTVADRLTRSKQTVPHFYLRRTVRLDALHTMRAELNGFAPRRISVNDLVLRAVAKAHVAVPEANVVWTDEEVHRFDSVDVAVAIASERGLVTPVLRGVEAMSVDDISHAVAGFVAQAAAGRLHQRDLEGGSITVTNLGMLGVEEFSAIINPPHSAILAVGAAVPTPVVVGDQIAIASVAHLVLSVDHRAIDGALAARWMEALVAAINQPLRLLT